MTERICRHCHRLKSEHCVFEPLNVPPGCVCDPATWGNEIEPVCEKYVGNGVTVCKTCAHEKECHAEPKT
jgi:hypothetical protein